MKIAVIGGDLRSLVAARLFFEDGHRVETFGFEGFGREAFTDCRSTPEECLEGAEALILPLPCSEGNGYVFSPFSSEKRKLSEILSLAGKSTRIFGGMLPDGVGFDYYKSERLLVPNAAATAEAAVGIAICELDITLFDAKALVLGYGRIGKCLSSKLKALSCSVCVAARKESDLVWAAENGCKTADFRELPDVFGDYDVIFNTVPQQIISEALLAKALPEALIIDLASSPGGIDENAALQAGVRVIKALSLPGKYSPVTAGRIIHDVINAELFGTRAQS